MAAAVDKKTALVLEIQRMSTEDGPGIRTTVFFKGCPLKCQWCHNPESISPRPQLQWVGARCIGCRSCVSACPEGALAATPQGVAIDRGLCRGCGRCAEACPSTALEILGREWVLPDLLHEVMKDRAYFAHSDQGGVTASGGEPVLQGDFVAAFFKGLQEKGIHTALDTCGLYAAAALEKLLPCTDLVLFDLKEIDPGRHKRFTGHGNQKILKNLVFLADYIRSRERPPALWIRTPVIPGKTARADNIRGIGNFIATRLGPVVGRWELLAFNNLCRDKYRRLGLSWELDAASPPSPRFMEQLAHIAAQSGVPPHIVQWSGMTALAENHPEEPHGSLQCV